MAAPFPWQGYSHLRGLCCMLAFISRLSSTHGLAPTSPWCYSRARAIFVLPLLLTLEWYLSHVLRGDSPALIIPLAAEKGIFPSWKCWGAKDMLSPIAGQVTGVCCYLFFSSCSCDFHSSLIKQKMKQVKLFLAWKYSSRKSFTGNIWCG